MNKIYSFDAFRFILALCIIMYHTDIVGGKILQQGYLACEVFFILSGFLLAKSYFKYRDIIHDKLDLFKKMLVNKFNRLYPEYIFMTIIVVIGYYFMFHDNRFLTFFYNSVFFSHMGVANNIIDGTWFISTLFWGTFVTLYLMIWGKEKYFFITAPLMFFLCVVPLFQQNHQSLHQIGKLVFPVITAGLLRTFAGLAIGCIVYYLCKIIYGKINKKITVLFAICGILGMYGLAELMMSKPEFLSVYNIYFFAAIGILGLVIYNNNLKFIFDFGFWRYLGRISYMLFLTNIFVLKIFAKYIQRPEWFNLNYYQIVTIVSCVIVAAVLYHTQKYLFAKLKVLLFGNNTPGLENIKTADIMVNPVKSDTETK